VRLKVTFAVLNLFNAHNSGNIACFNYTVFAHNWNAHAACDLNFIVKGLHRQSRTLKKWLYLGNSAR